MCAQKIKIEFVERTIPPSTPHVWMPAQCDAHEKLQTHPLSIIQEISFSK